MPTLRSVTYATYVLGSQLNLNFPFIHNIGMVISGLAKRDYNLFFFVLVTHSLNDSFIFTDPDSSKNGPLAAFYEAYCAKLFINHLHHNSERYSS